MSDEELLKELPKPEFGRSALRTLGRAVRAGGELSLEQRDRVDVFRRHAASMTSALTKVVRQTLDERFPKARLEVTGRDKSWLTIVDKLERGTSLERIRDVVGVRVVLPPAATRTDQDNVSAVLQGAFGAAVQRVIDRRVEPSHGYRAVHLELRVHGTCCEIQIRTRFQHQWAEISEQTSDVLGRELRYGGSPHGLDQLDEIRWRLILLLGDVLSDHEVIALRHESLRLSAILLHPVFWLRLRWGRRSQERALTEILRDIEASIQELAIRR